MYLDYGYNKVERTKKKCQNNNAFQNKRGHAGPMGIYLNPGSNAFQMALGSQIFIDKSRLIEEANRCAMTMQRFICVSRPRRFGKSMAADMLAAYYGRGEDTAGLFDKLAAGQSASYQKHLNRYDVIKVNMQEFLSTAESVEGMLKLLQGRLIADLRRSYPDCPDGNYLVFVMKDIYASTGCPFVILIDEWDCPFREYRQDKDAQKKYLDFLRVWLKDQDYVALAYMTGILPIKKYGSHSALNMFTEYSMTNSGAMAEYFGFTKEEVKGLCETYEMSFEETRAWYDGYRFLVHRKEGDEERSIYNPKSVVEAMLRHQFGPYWNQTETYEALKAYIQMDMDGLKSAVVEMLGGKAVRINVGTFSNDMTTLTTRDDVLTLLVHLGYLTYNSMDETVSIPNREVSREYLNAISTMDWTEVIRSIEDSHRLLEAMWNLDGNTVAEGVDRMHNEISVLQYNDENSLSCVINLAFYAAREYYTLIRELPTGKGFADICMLPRRMHADKPAAVIELKWNKSVSGALAQIEDRNYTEALRDYRGNLLLVGINYNRKSKKHSCIIRKMEKE